MSLYTRLFQSVLGTYLIFLVLASTAVLHGCGQMQSDHSADAFSQNVPNSFFPKSVTLREVEDAALKELVLEDLVFVDSSGTSWQAPMGTYTDGASVPRLALWISNGRFNREVLKAAIVHDAYCQVDNKERCKDQYQTRPWEDVHRMFFEALLAGGTSNLTARIMYAAVYLGGPRWNDPTRDLSQVDDQLLVAEFNACQDWIMDKNPSRQKIEAWMEKRESQLLNK